MELEQLVPAMCQQDGAEGVLVEARHLHRCLRRGVDLLQDISLCIRPSELIVLAGPSGAGKTTLMDALSGYRLASEGQVCYDGVDLAEHLNTFRTRIGVVPQREIMHLDLTVHEALVYAAKLRLPPGTRGPVREKLISDVLNDLDLNAQQHVRVRNLSGGQQKRVSIGIELLTQPHLFFLDEPTSGLDPHTAVELMELLRKLARQGRTIFVSSHSTRDMVLADQVLFMVRGGYMAWYGSPNEALAYFDTFRTPEERKHGPMDFNHIYGLVADPGKGTPQQWSERYKEHPFYASLIAEPLRLSTTGDKPQNQQQIQIARASNIARQRQAGALRQMSILTARAMKLVIRDRTALVLMLLAPPLLTSMILILTTRDMFDLVTGNPSRIVLSFSLLVFMAMAIGAMSFMREIVKEKEIFKREHHVNLKILPYVLSKVWVVFVFALYQATCWLTGLYLAVHMPGGWETALYLSISLFLATFVGMLLGLVASALSATEGAAPLLTAMLIMPQIMFSGALLPIPQLNAVGAAITDIMPARFVFEAMVTASGYGTDVANDPGWALSAKQRQALTDEQKRGDRCLGPNIFTECNFPGVRQFYNPAVNQPAPVTPTPPNGSQISSQALNQYLRSLSDYQARYATWSRLRSQAITGAEARIGIDYTSFGPIYNVNLNGHWLDLAITTVILIVVLAIIQRTKGA